MLWTIFVILWFCGFWVSAFISRGGLIHLLLVVALVVLIFNLCELDSSAGDCSESLVKA